MELRNTMRIAVALFFVGSAAFYLIMGLEAGIWFAVGSGLALVNILLAIWAVRKGLGTFKNKSIFLGLLLMKSMSFLMMITVVLVFLKPLLLPFTLGIGVVIFGAIASATIEARSLLKMRDFLSKKEGDVRA